MVLLPDKVRLGVPTGSADRVPRVTVHVDARSAYPCNDQVKSPAGKLVKRLLQVVRQRHCVVIRLDNDARAAADLRARRDDCPVVRDAHDKRCVARVPFNQLICAPFDIGGVTRHEPIVGAASFHDTSPDVRRVDDDSDGKLGKLQTDSMRQQT